MDTIVENNDVYAEKLLEAALLYASFGWKVVPCYEPIRGSSGVYHCACDDPKCTSVGKHPYFHKKLLPNGLRSASDDASTIRAWWNRWPRANIAVVGGHSSGLVILDFDFKSGGDDSLRELEVEHGPLPTSAKIRTGNGIHVYFKHPGTGVRIPSGTGVLGPGVDIRAEDGYAIAAPSFHPRGHEYHWMGGMPSSLDDVHQMPSWLIEFFERRSTERSKRIEENHSRRSTGKRRASEFSLEEKRTRCQAYVTAISGVAEGGRNETAAKSVCPIGLDFDLDEDEFWPILQSWNFRNSPPLDDRELRRTLFSANRSREYPRGCKLEHESEEWASRRAEQAERDHRYEERVQTEEQLWSLKIIDAEYEVASRPSRMIEPAMTDVVYEPPAWVDQIWSTVEQQEESAVRTRRSSSGGSGGRGGGGGDGDGGSNGDEEPRRKRSGRTDGNKELRSTSLMDINSSSSLEGPDGLTRTEIGNAQRIIRDHGNDIRYVSTTDQWYIWTECKWNEDDKGEIMGEMVAKTMRSMHRLMPAASQVGEEFATSWRSWIKTSESLKCMKNSLTIAGTFSSIGLVPNDFDQDHFLVNTPSCVVDIRDMSVHAADRKMLMSKVTSVGFDPGEDCPTWKKFLHRIFNGDQELVSYFQRAAGYSLTGSTAEQCLFFCYGTGKNGKSTAITAMQEIAHNYGRSADISSFLENKNDSGSNDLARLQGARLVAATEPSRGKRLAEDVIKRVTSGNDKITARFLYSEFFEFTLRAKIWLAANHKPQIAGTDEGIWRRIRLIPFTVQITEDEKDPELDKKLRKEYPGILRWMLEGANEWYRDGLGMPNAVSAATKRYRNEMDFLASFIQDNCLVNEGMKVQASIIYDAYKSWSMKNGEKKFLSSRHFSLALEERGFTRKRSSGGNLYVGLGLLEPGQEPQAEQDYYARASISPSPDEDHFDGPMQQLGFDD